MPSSTEALWPVLKCYQLLGCFPLYKDPKNSFVAFPTWRYLVIVATVSTIIFTSTLLLMVRLGFNDTFRIILNLGGPISDSVTFSIIYFACHALHISIVWRNFQIKARLAELLNYLKPIRIKSRWLTFAYLTMSIISIMLGILGYGWLVMIELRKEKPSAVELAMFLPTSALYMLWLYGPLVAFVTTFADVCGSLSQWADKLKDLNKLNPITVKYFS